MIVASEPGSSTRENEDAVRADEHCAVVVDGAGVPERYRAGCHHTVAWYADELAEALFAALRDPAGRALRDCLRQAIAEVAALHAHECDLDAGSPSATVAALRVTPDRVEALVLADAAIVHRTAGITEVLTDDRLGDLVAQYRGSQIDDEFGPWIEALRNVPGGFWCAQHLPDAADEALARSWPRPATDAVLAVSDGVSRLWEFLGHDPADVLAAAHDASSLIDRLRHDEVAHTDDLRSRGLFKAHDDASLALWRAGD